MSSLSSYHPVPIFSSLVLGYYAFFSIRFEGGWIWVFVNCSCYKCWRVSSRHIVRLLSLINLLEGKQAMALCCFDAFQSYWWENYSANLHVFDYRWGKTSFYFLLPFPPQSLPHHTSLLSTESFSADITLPRPESLEVTRASAHHHRFSGTFLSMESQQNTFLLISQRTLNFLLQKPNNDSLTSCFSSWCFVREVVTPTKTEISPKGHRVGYHCHRAHHTVSEKIEEGICNLSERYSIECSGFRET